MCGYKVIKTNAIENVGISDLKKALKNNTTVFAGQSGVRKINTYKQTIKFTSNRNRRNKQKK